MADDLDDFLSELGISKGDSSVGVNPTTAGDSATDPSDFLDWLNEPTKPLAFDDNSTGEAVPTSAQTHSTPDKAVNLADNITGNDVSLISEMPTPPKLESLPLQSLDDISSELVEAEAVSEQPIVSVDEQEGIGRKEDISETNDFNQSNENDDFGFESGQSAVSHHQTEQQEPHSVHVASASFDVDNQKNSNHEDVAVEIGEPEPKVTDFGFVEMPTDDETQDQTVAVTANSEEELDKTTFGFEESAKVDQVEESAQVDQVEESEQVDQVAQKEAEESFGFEEGSAFKNDEIKEVTEDNQEPTEQVASEEQVGEQEQETYAPAAATPLGFDDHSDIVDRNQFFSQQVGEEQEMNAVAETEFEFDEDSGVVDQNKLISQQTGEYEQAFEHEREHEKPSSGTFDPVAALQQYEEEMQAQYGQDEGAPQVIPSREFADEEGNAPELIEEQLESGLTTFAEDEQGKIGDSRPNQTPDISGFPPEQGAQLAQANDEMRENQAEFDSNGDFEFGEEAQQQKSFAIDDDGAATNDFEFARQQPQEQGEFHAEFEFNQQGNEQEEFQVAKTDSEFGQQQHGDQERVETEAKSEQTVEEEYSSETNAANSGFEEPRVSDSIIQEEPDKAAEGNPFSLPISSGFVESTPTAAFSAESHITDFFMGTNMTGINHESEQRVDLGEVAFSTGGFYGEGAKPGYDIQENDTGFQAWGEPPQQYEPHQPPPVSSSGLFESSTIPSNAVGEESLGFETPAFSQSAFEFDQDQHQLNDEEEDVELFRSKSISKPEQEDDDDFDFSYNKPSNNEQLPLGETLASPTSDSISLQMKSLSSQAVLPPRLDLSFNDISSDATPSQSSNQFQFSRRDSRPSMSSVPPTPSSGAYAPLSSVRPIPPAERLALWSAALKAFSQQRPSRLDDDGSQAGNNDQEEDEEDEEDAAMSDHSVCPRALEVLDSISTSKMQGARLVWALRRLWGGALGVRGIGFADRDFNVSDRTASLLRALFGFHDPELTLHLDHVTSFTWSRRPALFGFYGSGGGETNAPAVLELWDLGIVKVHPGFETPQSGSMFFAFGACASRRLQLLQSQTMEQVFSLFEEINYSMRMSNDEASRWAIFSSRIARETPRTFRNLLSQVELDLSMLSDMPVYEDGTSDDYVEPSVETARPAQPMPNDFEIDVPNEEDDERTSLKSSSTGSRKQESASTSSAADQTSKPPLSATGSTTTAATSTTSSWSRWKELATKTAKQWSEKLAGPIDLDDPNGSKAAYKRLTESSKPRRIRLVVLDQNHLGCKLALTKQGLMCVGYPASEAGKQMQQKGVKEGDLIHAINGATILLLSPAMAEMVAQKQERPLYCTIGTTNDAPFARKLNKERLNEAKKMLMKPLSEFYARHGPSKVDRCEEILELYAGRERALLSGLVEKYGEMVPGDELLRCDSGAAIVSADEVVDFLEHPDDRDHLLVDIRDITERADTGYFAASILYGHNDVIDRLREAKRTYLIGSGRAREFCIADPIRAKAEARLDLERTKIIVDRLWRDGIKRVSIVSGGFSQLYKEVKSRGVDCLITAQGSGTDFKLMELYLNLDFENPMSAAQFLTGHVSAKPAKQRRSSSVTSEATEALYHPQPPPSVGSSTLVHRGSTHSSTRRSNAGIHDASSQLATEEDEDDDLFLPDPPVTDTAQPQVAQAGAATTHSVGSGSSATAKAASAAAKDMAAMASNTWSKWVAPALNKRKQSEQ